MPELKFHISSQPDPVTIDWNSLEAGAFQAHCSTGQQLAGKLVWLSDKSGLITLSPEQDPSSSAKKVYPFYRINDNSTTTTIWVEGQILTVTQPSREPRRAGANASTPSGAFDGKLRAPLPGKVLRLLVKPGDAVEASVPLVILESMKMETTLTAPVAADIETVLINPNDLVDKGSVLMHLKTKP
jgi:biotin carboxyl carrier protein